MSVIVTINTLQLKNLEILHIQHC